MKFVLKDKKLYKFLTDSYYDFSSRFQDACEKQWYDASHVVAVFLDEDPVSQIVFYKSGIIKEEDYNPNGWNTFPEVNPPEDVIMCVEGDYDYKGAAVFKEGEWRYQRSMEKLLWSNSVKRFRPWNI